MSDIGNIIETLAIAKTALEENPVLKSQLEDMKAHIAKLEDAHMQLQAKHADLHNNHDEACIKVTELEASLEAARFQELAANKKLNKLAEIVGEALHEALPPVEPVVEPEPVLVDQSANVGVITESAVIPEHVWNDIETNSQQDDTPQPPVEPTENPTIESPPVGPSIGEPILSSGDSEMIPFVTNPIAEPKPESIQSKPHDGKPYSFKPNSCTWREWIEGGGQRPWWLTEDVLDQMDVAPQSAAS
jgi:hypothetical protein